MALFSFGSKKEQKNAKVLGPNLTALFGGEEGKEMIVDASESGISAIDTAEAALKDATSKYEALEEQATAHSEEINALTAEKEALKSQNSALKAEIEDGKKQSATHTIVSKNEDTSGGDQTKKLSFEIEEDRQLQDALEFDKKFNP